MSQPPGPAGPEFAAPSRRRRQDEGDSDPAVEDWTDEEWDVLDEELAAETTPSRWVTMASIAGAALVAIVALQVLLAIVEGLSYKTNEPQGVPTGDFFHRLGYPFGSLGTTALLFLVVGVALLSLPAYFEEATTASQDRVAGIVLLVAAVTAVVLALGSLLAVRANFHVYAENGRSVPTYVIVQYVAFLIGNLGTAVIAFYAAMQTKSLRSPPLT